jgi:signal transduction histidine kinase
MKEPPLTLSIAVREAEQRRLARLLEDGLDRSLSLLLAQAHAWSAALAPSSARAAEAAHPLSRTIACALTDLRDLVADLAPEDLDDLGLTPALKALVARIERRYCLTLTLDLPRDPTGHTAPLPPHTALAAYLIAQEALDNAGWHAGTCIPPPRAPTRTAVRCLGRTKDRAAHASGEGGAVRRG